MFESLLYFLCCVFSEYAVHFVIGNPIERQIGTHESDESAGRCPVVGDVDQGDRQAYPLQLHLISPGSSNISVHAADIGNDINLLCIRMIDLVLVVHNKLKDFLVRAPKYLRNTVGGFQSLAFTLDTCSPTNSLQLILRPCLRPDLI